MNVFSQISIVISVWVAIGSLCAVWVYKTNDDFVIALDDFMDEYKKSIDISNNLQSTVIRLYALGLFMFIILRLPIAVAMDAWKE